MVYAGVSIKCTIWMLLERDKRVKILKPLQGFINLGFKIVNIKCRDWPTVPKKGEIWQLASISFEELKLKFEKIIDNKRANYRRQRIEGKEGEEVGQG